MSEDQERLKGYVDKWLQHHGVKEAVHGRSPSFQFERAKQFVRGCCPNLTEDEVESVADKVIKVFPPLKPARSRS